MDNQPNGQVSADATRVNAAMSDGARRAVGGFVAILPGMSDFFNRHVRHETTQHADATKEATVQALERWATKVNSGVDQHFEAHNAVEKRISSMTEHGVNATVAIASGAGAASGLAATLAEAPEAVQGASTLRSAWKVAQNTNYVRSIVANTMAAGRNLFNLAFAGS